MINPDHISIVDGECITSPDVLFIDIGDGNISVRVKCRQ
jgi:hypothetical protein